MKPCRNQSEAAVLLLILAVSMVCLLNRFSVNPVSANSSGVVYYTSDANFVYVYHPNLNVTIRFTRANFGDGGTITSIQYKGSANIVNVDPQFGFISLYNLNGSSLSEYIGGTTLISATGNNTGQLTLTFQATVVNDGLNGTVISGIISIIQYTFYADIDNIFDTVTFTSTQTTWLYAHAEYGASLNMITFTSYNATGFQYHNSTSGNLIQGGTTPIDGSPFYNVLTVMNATANLAVTVFPTSVRPCLGVIKDGTAGTKLALYGQQVSTYDTRNGGTVVWGSYWGNGISYSVCWALSSGGSPFIVVPWTMPNSVPFGLYQTYDDMPGSTGDYDSYPPNASAINMNTWLAWVYNATGRRVTLNLLYDQLTGSGTPNSTGADGSWLVHGTHRLANMASDHKVWMASVQGQQIDFQTHAYHHDYPWPWEFSLMQNVTWINATFYQMWLDAQTLGMGNATFQFFKPAGFNFEPEGLNVTTAYGIKMQDRNFDPTMAPLFTFYMDASGKLLVLSTDVCDITDEINENTAYPQLVNDLEGNLSTLNFVSIHGHFPSTLGNWSTYNNVFAAAESLYGNNMDYFLPSEMSAYWDILATLTYTFNTTGLFALSSDSRLSYELLNRPASFSLNGMLSYSGTVPSAHEIYSPDFDTNGWTFNRATGFASITSISNTTSQGLQFSVSQPQNTTGHFSVYMPLGNPQIISGVESSTYNATTHFLMLVTNGSSNITATYSASPLFSDGFESGNFAGWNNGLNTAANGTGNVTTAMPKEGLYAANLSQASQSGSYARVDESLSTAQQTLYLRAYFYFNSLSIASGNAERLCRVKSSVYGSTAFLGLANNSGAMEFYIQDATNSTWTYDTVDNVVTGTYYSVEMKVYVGVGAADGDVVLWVNGMQRAERTGMNLVQYGNSNEVQLGCVVIGGSGNVAVQLQLDSVVIDSSYIGPIGTRVFLFSDDFESSSFSAGGWTNATTGSGSTSVSQTNPYQGLYSAKFTANVPDTADMRKGGWALSSMNVRAYFHFSTIPLSGQFWNILMIRDSNTNTVVRLRIGNGTSLGTYWQLTYVNGGQTGIITNYTSISANTWYCLEIGGVCNAVNGSASYWVNGNLMASVQGLNDTSFVGFYGPRIGIQFSGSGTESITMYVDNVAVDSSYIGTVQP